MEDLNKKFDEFCKKTAELDKLINNELIINRKMIDRMANAIEVLLTGCPKTLFDWMPVEGCVQKSINCSNKHQCWIEYFRYKAEKE